MGAVERLAKDDPYEFQWWANWMLGVQNYREKKKGADKGIDGIIYFHNVPHGVGQIIVSVKAGQNINPGMLESLSGVLSRESAELGVFVCAVPLAPDHPMYQRAAAQGIVRVGKDRFPKIQIVTAQDLLSDKAIHLPRPIETAAFTQPLRPVRPTKIATPEPQLSFALPILGGKAKSTDVEEHLSGRIIGSRVAAA
jgi:site-specific DNA-methyltransferase (adenine-specific)